MGASSVDTIVEICYFGCPSHTRARREMPQQHQRGTKPGDPALIRAQTTPPLPMEATHPNMDTPLSVRTRDAPVEGGHTHTHTHERA